MLALLLVALSLGLSNFAAAIGIGIAGVDARTRLRVGVVFGLFEAGMPILGLLLGRGLAGTLGHATKWTGAGLLIATGAALSIDNLAVGFALGGYQVSLAVAAVIIGAVSVALSLPGLELGDRLGARTGANGEVLGGIVLIGVGIAVATGAR